MFKMTPFVLLLMVKQIFGWYIEFQQEGHKIQPEIEYCIARDSALSLLAIKREGVAMVHGGFWMVHCLRCSVPKPKELMDLAISGED